MLVLMRRAALALKVPTQPLFAPHSDYRRGSFNVSNTFPYFPYALRAC
jgi:hypothetical protein